MAFLPIFAVIIAFILLVIIVIYKLSQNPRMNVLDVTPNSPQIFNFTKQNFTEGGMNLIEKDLKKNKNGTFTLYSYKLDMKQGENAPKPKLYKFVILQSNLPTIWTNGDRIIKAIISKNPMDYPEEIRNTTLGKSMISLANKNQVDETFGEMFKEKDKVINQMIIDSAGGEITSHRYGQMKEEVSSFFKTIQALKDKEEK